MKNTIDCSNRHAFLIMAHKDDVVFRTLIRMLDNPRNDIFIHMDLKNKNYKEPEISSLVKNCNIYHCPRIKVTWGGYSMIMAELLLLKEASEKGHYKYYHLLSGQDLPIKKQEYIQRFFDDNGGKEFVQFQSPTFSFQSRVRYYHLLQEKIGKAGPFVIRACNKVLLGAQKGLGINRNTGVVFQKGANWFSITDGLARYVLSKEMWIEKTFKHTKCCDEVFLQTIVTNSEYNDNLFHDRYDDNPCAIMRLADFKRGNPYIFRKSDYSELEKSNCLFARKFDAAIDQKIVNDIFEKYR